MQFHQLHDLYSWHNVLQLYRTVSVSNDTQFHHLRDSYKLTRTLSWNDTLILSVYDEIQGHQVILHVITLKRITFTTWQRVRPVRVVPLETSLSRLEQVVSIGQTSNFGQAIGKVN